MKRDLQECPNCKVLQDEIRRMVEQQRRMFHPHDYTTAPDGKCLLPELYCQDPKCKTHAK